MNRPFLFLLLPLLAAADLAAQTAQQPNPALASIKQADREFLADLEPGSAAPPAPAETGARPATPLVPAPAAPAPRVAAESASVSTTTAVVQQPTAQVAPPPVAPSPVAPSTLALRENAEPVVRPSTPPRASAPVDPAIVAQPTAMVTEQSVPVVAERKKARVAPHSESVESPAPAPKRVAKKKSAPAEPSRQVRNADPEIRRAIPVEQHFPATAASEPVPRRRSMPPAGLFRSRRPVFTDASVTTTTVTKPRDRDDDDDDDEDDDEDDD